jgi:CRP-like cAMP-binding protein
MRQTEGFADVSPKGVGSGARNRFLAALPLDVSQRVRPLLQQVTFRRGTVLEHAETAVKYLYFPDRGLISLMKVMHDGQASEVGMIGTEGMVGLSALLGIPEAAFETIVQLDGEGRRLSVAALQAEMTNTQLKQLVLRYANYRINRFGQLVACNRLHNLRQRCCRWLLTAADYAQTTTICMTHEQLAEMVGTHRPALSSTLSTLQHDGLIKMQRCSIIIENRTELAEACCECYGALKLALECVYG